MAKSTIKLSAKMGEGFRTEIECSNPFVIDQPKAGGGTDEGPNPLEIFLSSLPACICAIGRIIAMQRRFELRGIEVDVEGDIDKDFLMGKTTVGRSGFTEIRSLVRIDADLTEQQKNELLHEIEKRCPIADNMAEKSVLKAEICSFAKS
jgi:putative redox protein